MKKPLGVSGFFSLIPILLIGIVLRTIWVEDMEYKKDERDIAGYALGQPGYEKYPWVGVISGVGIPNPGLSVWVNEAAASVLPLQTPIDIARWIQFLSILALFGLVVFAAKIVPPDERNFWFWGIALMAVNPIAVLLARKIWSPSIYPIWSLAFFWAWWMRQSWWGAFLWGMIGMLLGQIHMSGFFLAAALWSWTLFFGPALLNPPFLRRPTWLLPWSLGSALGALPLIPWVYFLFKNISRTESRFNPMMIFQFQFWRFWIKNSTGMGLSYSLGRGRWIDFLRYPLISGYSTYFVGVLHLILVSILVLTLMKSCCSIWEKRRSWKQMVMGTESSTAFLQNAAFWGFGIGVSLTGFYVQNHYLIVLFPLQWVWISRQLLLHWKHPLPVLVTFFIVQLLITCGFLTYIHQNHGAVGGDYGLAYRYQL